jgi:hypothetical protein
MDQSDAFFTHTIVGAPLTVLLGRRQPLPTSPHGGMEIETGTGQSRLSRNWADWAVLSHACDPVGHPRMRPGPLRRRLERHALLIALAGLAALTGTAIFWGVQVWS